MEIRFPDLEDRVQGPHSQLGVEATVLVHDEPKVFTIDYFTVTVEFAVNVSEAALRVDSQEGDLRELHNQIDRADALVIETAARTRRWLFVQQPNLGPSEELPRLVRSERIKEKSSGREIAVAPTLKAYALMSAEEIAVRPDTLSELASHLAGREEPPAPETLLAQAQAALNHQTGRVIEPQLAVLLAAVAAEVKAKRTWQETVTNEGRPLLDLMLTNPRAFPQSAIDLFDKVAVAVSGRSFRHEHRDRFNNLRALFELRNSVAHEAAPIDEQRARTAVSSVPSAFAWLEQLRPARATPKER